MYLYVCIYIYIYAFIYLFILIYVTVDLLVITKKLILLIISPIYSPFRVKAYGMLTSKYKCMDGERDSFVSVRD